ncbi:MAG: VOC family protein, partial [Dehalococcoidia bacterium]|nr:VOC family protein [Dehalococcoidia bacterium]
MAKITTLGFVVPVRDLDAAARFYCDAFDLRPVFQNEQIVFVGIPGTDTALGLLLDPDGAGRGPMYVGLHVVHAVDREEILSAIEQAGGSVVERAEHAPGVPFA